MNTIDLGYVIPGAYSGLSRIRGCSSLCCTKQASVGTRIDQLVHLRQVHPLKVHPYSAPTEGYFLNKGVCQVYQNYKIEAEG